MEDISQGHGMKGKAKYKALLCAGMLPALVLSTAGAAPPGGIMSAAECDANKRMVGSNDFQSGTAEGEGVVVSYFGNGSPVLRIQQGYAISVKQDMGGWILNADVDIRNSRTGTADGKTLRHDVTDGNLSHEAFHFVGIGDGVLSVKDLDGKEKNLPFDSGTRFCLSN